MQAISRQPSLGARLTAGQRTLNPYVEVRILRPQPEFYYVPSWCGEKRLEPSSPGEVTPVTWAFTPDWFTIPQAWRLSGWDPQVCLS